MVTSVSVLIAGGPHDCNADCSAETLCDCRHVAEDARTAVGLCCTQNSQVHCTVSYSVLLVDRVFTVLWIISVYTTCGFLQLLIIELTIVIIISYPAIPTSISALSYLSLILRSFTCRPIGHRLSLAACYLAIRLIKEHHIYLRIYYPFFASPTSS